MIYIVRSVKIVNDGTVKEARRRQRIIWPTNLNIGGMYFLRPNKLCRVEGVEQPGI